MRFFFSLLYHNQQWHLRVICNYQLRFYSNPLQKLFISHCESFIKESPLPFLNTFKCWKLQLQPFAPHNSDLGLTYGANYYFVHYQFTWIYEKNSAVDDWDGKAEQDRSHKQLFGFPLCSIFSHAKPYVQILMAVLPSASARTITFHAETPMCLLPNGVVMNSAVRSPKSRECRKGHRYVRNQHRICLSPSFCYTDRSYTHHCCTYDYNLS